MGPELIRTIRLFKKTLPSAWTGLGQLLELGVGTKGARTLIWDLEYCQADLAELTVRVFEDSLIAPLGAEI